MCRLFGFRSVISSQVHHSLVRAENALMLQSEEHPDGWGVAYYECGTPHVVKSAATAVHDQLFQRVSGIVSSETVIAHLRKATVGQSSIINSHPFQYGPWVFSHNGNIKNFDQHRDAIRALISERLRRFILGDTDSEVMFYLILTHLSKIKSLGSNRMSVEEVVTAVRSAVEEICKIVGPYSLVDDEDPKETFLTFLLTNGNVMLGFQGGKNLYYSTHKERCSERESCSSFNPDCERPTQSGYVSHLLFASEPLSGENVWLPLEPGKMVGVGANMKLRFFE